MESDRILLTHGSGGRLMRDLIRQVILPVFDNPLLRRLEDASALPDHTGTGGEGRLVLTTDSYVVNPLFFPGGDIGKLACCGTVNDLATAGARPVALSLGLIIEEGFPFKDLEKILNSMKQAAGSIPVPIITGDTKVVERGKGDGVYISTTGVGLVQEGVHLTPARMEPGDAVIINGAVGNHEAAILCARKDFSLGVDVRSDCTSLWGLMEKVLGAVPETRCARDPTRGGVVAVLSELVETTGLGIALEEDAIPVDEPVRSLCEILGLDPLLMANEGKMIIVVPERKAEECLSAMRKVPEGEGSRVIGRVHGEKARLSVRTPYGTSRVLTLPAGNQLPRIC